MDFDSPGDCALAFAIPLTRERFLTALAQPEKYDFVFHFRKGRGLERANPEFCWKVYEAEELAFVSAVCEKVAGRGVTIVHDVDLTQLTALFGRFSVVTLVAHSRLVEDEADIEFSDGLHTTPELIRAIPIDFSGLLDLTVCYSVIPAAAIRSERRCLVAGNRKPAELRSRMYLYGLEIELLANNPQKFVDVIKQVHSRRDLYDNKGGTLWKILGWLSSVIRRRRR